MINIRICIIILCTSLIVFNTEAATKKTKVKRYSPFVELSAKKSLTGKKGFKRDIGRLGFVIPVLQNTRSVGFVTMIGMGDTNKAFEGNFGFGYRAFYNRYLILGGYGFYDLRRTPNKNKMHQATIGAEAMMRNIEVRANIYLPISTTRLVSNNEYYDVNYSQSRDITTVKECNNNISETAMNGFDLEAGGSLPQFERLQGFLTFYRFRAENAESIYGIRLRTNYAVTNWFAIDGECSNDKKAGFVSYLGVKFNWLFSNKKLTNTFTNDIHRKMTQLPVRDIDIVTSEISKVVNNLEHQHKGELLVLNKSNKKVKSNTNNLTGIAKNKIKFSNILLISKDSISYVHAGSVKHVSGKKPVTSKAVDLKQYNIKNVNVNHIKNTAPKEFKNIIGDLKVTSKLLTFEQSIDLGLQNNRQALDSIFKISRNNIDRNNVITRAVARGIPNSQIIKSAVDANAPHAEVTTSLMNNGVELASLITNNDLNIMAVIRGAQTAGTNDSDIADTGLNNGIDASDLFSSSLNVNTVFARGRNHGISRNDLIQAAIDGNVSHVDIADTGLNNGVDASDLFSSNLNVNTVFARGRNHGISRNDLIQAAVDGNIPDAEIIQVATNNATPLATLMAHASLDTLEVIREAQTAGTNDSNIADTGLNNGVDASDLFSSSLNANTVFARGRNYGIASNDLIQAAVDGAVPHAEIAQIAMNNATPLVTVMSHGGLNAIEAIRGVQNTGISDTDVVNAGYDANIHEHSIAHVAYTNGVEARDLFSSSLDPRHVYEALRFTALTPNQVVRAALDSNLSTNEAVTAALTIARDVWNHFPEVDNDLVTQIYGY